MPQTTAIAPPRPISRFLRETVLALGVGIVIGLLLWIADGGEGTLAPHLVGSAWMGLWIYGLCRLAGVVFEAPLERLSPNARRFALGILFFVAGMAAWGAGVATLPFVTFGWMSWSTGDSWLRAAAFTGLLGLLLGLTFFSFGLLHDRLRDSVAQLKEQEFALRELVTAREIQQCLLPPPEIHCSGYRVTARSEPAQVVAGDFYDAFSLPDGSFAVAVGDVAGKGMGASLLMASVKAMLPLVAMERSAAQTLRELNRRLARDLGPRQFVAMAFLRIEPGTGRFQLANAGLPDPYRLSREGNGAGPVEELVVSGPRLPLGVRDEVEYEEWNGLLSPGERLLMISDGLPEALTAGGEPLGYDGLGRLLADAGGLDAGEGLDDLFRRVEVQAGTDRDDDWTALLLEPKDGGDRVATGDGIPPDAGLGAVQTVRE